MVRHICISVVTRNRPIMLQKLFKSFRHMHRPLGERISFLIVENDPKQNLREEIEDFREAMPSDQIIYRNETVLGISSARNHALEYALEHRFDFLVFVDDDEFVECDWLVNLLAARDRRDLDIVGSPVRPTPVEGRLTLEQQLVWSGIRRGGLKSEQKCRRRCDAGRGHLIKVATGSWIGRVEFFRNTGLRFETDLGLTGGEDWHLWSKAKVAGAKSGWAVDAIVYETVPHARLTFSYHFRRSRDHNITEYMARYSCNPRRTLKNLPWRIAGRFIKCVAVTSVIPLRGAEGLVSFVSALGGVVGLVQGAFGARSSHYSQTTGF
ncbi:glycosyl transferase 2 family protein (plasmid) [Ochrobactrum quorumnocens]|uniref:Glycosyl transferase 2 family protein n=1 Tax=Ochrobactrum quorumnocens TaxID=271865 RepID=A0A248UMR6_9HYPH|nr:glycosyltransferase [[Ochrobactrum] quorumnocens]ASV87912.1 glycosyl transferase 2 family protein [[Ochrobactrum] quorumnocens]